MDGEQFDYHPRIRPHRLVRSGRQVFILKTGVRIPLGSLYLRRRRIMHPPAWINRGRRGHSGWYGWFHRAVPLLVISLATAVGAAPLYQLQGRVDQTDPLDHGGTHVWIRPADAPPVRVLLDSSLGVPQLGDHITVQVQWDDPVADRARDGVVRTWRAATGTGWRTVRAMAQTSNVATLGALIVILALTFGAVLLLSRRHQRRTRSMGSKPPKPDWPMKPADLPEDPAEALAELARRADEEDR